MILYPMQRLHCCGMALFVYLTSPLCSKGTTQPNERQIHLLHSFFVCHFVYQLLSLLSQPLITMLLHVILIIPSLVLYSNFLSLYINFAILVSFCEVDECITYSCSCFMLCIPSFLRCTSCAHVFFSYKNTHTWISYNTQLLQ